MIPVDAKHLGYRIGTEDRTTGQTISDPAGFVVPEHDQRQELLRYLRWADSMAQRQRVKPSQAGKSGEIGVG